MGKPFLVLDLDNTLIFSTTSMAVQADFQIVVPGEEGDEHLNVKKRAGVDDFLQRMSRVYKVVLFSAGERDYVHKVAQHLDPQGNIFCKIYCRDDCEIRDDKRVKNLHAKAKELGVVDFARLVWLDDIPDFFELNRDNGIKVAKFEGAQDDSELRVLCPVLVALAKHSDFRRALALWGKGFLKADRGRLLELDMFSDDWVPLQS